MADDLDHIETHRIQPGGIRHLYPGRDDDRD